MGPQAAPTIWAILSGQGQLGEELDLDGSQREWLRSALRQWSSADVVRVLLAAVREDTGTDAKVDLIRIFAELSGAAPTQGVLEIMRKIDEVHLQSSRVQATVRSALARVLDAAPESMDVLRKELDSIPRGCWPILVEAIGATHSPSGPLLMARIARKESSLEAKVLEQACTGPRLLLDGGRAFLPMARAKLSSEEAVERRIAVVALGRLRDADSFMDLVDSLGDSDAVVRRCAQTALQATAGLQSRWGADRWRMWHEDELAWLGSVDDLGWTLRSGEAYEASVAAKELMRHPLYVETVNRALALGLDHPHPKVRSLAVDGLSQSAHSSAVDPLLAALQDDVESIRLKAQQGLASMSGESLGDDSKEWRRWWADLR